LGLSTVATSGSYSDLSNKPTIYSTLASLTDIFISSPSLGQVLRHNGTKFVNTKLNYSDLNGNPILVTALPGLSDVTITSPTSNQFLQYNGTKWVNSSAPTWAMSGLTDTQITSPVNGQLLKYNSFTNKWINYTIIYSDITDIPTLATVATSGSYSDLSNKPTIPTALASLSDVTLASPANSQVLQYNGTRWINTTLPPGITTLAGLTDVQLSSPSSTQILKYNGTKWANGAVAYSEITGTPTLAPVATAGTFTSLTGKPTNLAGYGITDAQSSTTRPWITKSAAYPLAAGDHIFADTSGGAFTLTLPPSPTQGMFVLIVDPKGTWATNNLVIAGNGSQIVGSPTSLTCDMNYATLEFAYDAVGTSWRITRH
jgi:hypothetical protein